MRRYLMKKLGLIVCIIPLMTLGACQTLSLSDIPEMTDAEFSKVTNLPEINPDAEGSATKKTFYSRINLVKKRGKKLYGAWADSASSACLRNASNAYISAKSEVSRSTESDACPEGSFGYGEELVKLGTDDDSPGLMDVLISAF